MIRSIRCLATQCGPGFSPAPISGHNILLLSTAVSLLCGPYNTAISSLSPLLLPEQRLDTYLCFWICNNIAAVSCTWMVINGI